MSINALVNAAACNLEKMKALREAQPELLFAAGPDGETAMGAAAHHGQKEAVAYLISRGYELDIFAACVLGQTEQVLGFLQADPGLIHGRAAHAHHYPILCFAVVSDQEEMAQLLLAHGADPAADDGITGYTALHCATEHGKVQMARWLILHGADPNAPLRPFGVTPLHMAATRGDLDLVEALLLGGANPSALTRDGERPLECALFMGHQEVAERLGQWTAPVDGGASE